MASTTLAAGRDGLACAVTTGVDAGRLLASSDYFAKNQLDQLAFTQLLKQRFCFFFLGDRGIRTVNNAVHLFYVHREVLDVSLTAYHYVL